MQRFKEDNYHGNIIQLVTLRGHRADGGSMVGRGALEHHPAGYIEGLPS